MAFQSYAQSASSDDNAMILRAHPMAHYFLLRYFSAGIKGEAVFNFTDNVNFFYTGLVPQATLPLPLLGDSFYLYINGFIGASLNSVLDNKYGYRYGNEIGLKFSFNEGAMLNFVIMYLFDNAGDRKSKAFQNIVIPVLGISGWF